MDSETREIDPGKQRFVAGAVTMGLITVLLFFVPLVNGVIGGALGGYRAAGAGRAVTASLMTMIPVAFVLYLIYGPVGAPVLGAPRQAAPLTLIAAACVGMPVGALLGGTVGGMTVPLWKGLRHYAGRGEPGGSRLPRGQPMPPSRSRS